MRVRSTERGGQRLVQSTHRTSLDGAGQLDQELAAFGGATPTSWGSPRHGTRLLQNPPDEIIDVERPRRRSLCLDAAPE